MEKLLKLDLFLNFIQKRKDQDFVDTLHSRVIPVMLMFAAAIICAKEYGGAPIQCWPNAEWPDYWLQYAQDFCFIESTYYIPLENPIPGSMVVRREKATSYYQYLPFILVAMAFVCMTPNFIWRTFSSMLGIQLEAVIEMSDDMRKNVSMDESDNTGWQIAQHINKALSLVVLHNPGLCACLGKYYCAFVNRWKRNRLTMFYLAIKLLYICNIIGQFFFLAYFLGSEKAQVWGLRMTYAFLDKGEQWQQTGLFPRITLCDLAIRMPNNKWMNYTVQCVLPANMLNEKIFLILFYVFLFLGLVAIVNVVYWAILLSFRCLGRDRVKRAFVLSVNQICPPSLTLPSNDNWATIDEEIGPGNDQLPVIVTHHRRAGSPDSEATTDSVNTNSTTTTSSSESSAGIVNQVRKRLDGSNFQLNANAIHVIPANATDTVNTAKKKDLDASDKFLVNSCRKVIEGIPLSHLEKYKLCTYIRQTSWVAKKAKEVRDPESRELTPYEKRYVVTSVRLFFRELFNEMLEEFLTFLGADGMLTIELMQTNSSEILASQVLGKLFCEFGIETFRPEVKHI